MPRVWQLHKPDLAHAGSLAWPGLTSSILCRQSSCVSSTSELDLAQRLAQRLIRQVSCWALTAEGLSAGSTGADTVWCAGSHDSMVCGWLRLHEGSLSVHSLSQWQQVGIKQLPL